MVPASPPIALDRIAETAISSPTPASTPRSRSLVVTALPVAALRPKTVRMPVRSAPTQPRPASSRVTKAMPVIVSVRLAGAVRLMMPLGFSPVLTMPGSALLSESAMASSHSGWPCNEAEDREGEREGREDREEGEVGHTRGEQIAVDAPVALRADHARVALSRSSAFWNADTHQLPDSSNSWTGRHTSSVPSS